MKLDLSTVRCLSRRRKSRQHRLPLRQASLFRNGSLRFNSFFSEVMDGLFLETKIDWSTQRFSFRIRRILKGEYRVHNRTIHLGKQVYRDFKSDEAVIKFTFPDQPDVRGWFHSL